MILWLYFEGRNQKQFKFEISSGIISDYQKDEVNCYRSFRKLTTAWEIWGQRGGVQLSSYLSYFSLRHAQSAPETQLSCTNDDELSSDVQESLQLSYAMSADIVLHARQHDMRLFKSFGDTDDSYKFVALDRMDSAIACLQIISGKSLSLLFAGSLQFYSFYATLVNFPKSAAWRHTMGEHTIVAYLPTALGRLPSIQETVPRSQAKIRSMIKIQTVKSLHKSIQLIPATLQSIALRKMICETQEEKIVLHHLMLP